MPPEANRNSSRFRATIGPSSLPQPRSAATPNLRASMRTTQPSFNFLTGESAPPSTSNSRHSLAGHSVRTVSLLQARDRTNSITAPSGGRPNLANTSTLGAPSSENHRNDTATVPQRIADELRAEVATLKHKISIMEDDHAREQVQRQSELDDQKRRALEDLERKQAAESDTAAAQRAVGRVQEELAEARETARQEKAALERRLRTLEERNQELEEVADEATRLQEEEARRHEKQLSDLKMQQESAERLYQELENEKQQQEQLLQDAQNQLVERDTTIGDLEAEVLRLKAQTGDAETMEIIKHELSEQVQHIRTLEANNRDYFTELKRLRPIAKTVEILEEEKRTLQRRLTNLDTLERQLDEAQIQRQRLEDERLAWTGYLQSVSEEDHKGAHDLREFDSPESVARALVQERFTVASQVEQIGSLRADLAAQESTIKGLEEEKKTLKASLKEARAAMLSSEPENKPLLRLERQRALAVKEVEYLKAQIRSYEKEATSMQVDGQEEGDQVMTDEEKLVPISRVRELEAVVEEYKAEVARLQEELTSLEQNQRDIKNGNTQGQEAPSSPIAGTKRSHASLGPDESSSEQVGELMRKVRQLQSDLSTAEANLKLKEKELTVSQKQLSAAKKRTQVRVLSLRSNPTSDYEAIKQATLDALKKENEDLLVQVQSLQQGQQVPDSLLTIPASQLAAVERAVDEARAETASAQKSARRLKEVWASKSLEFKEAIFSTLGWTVVFMPNGKMRVESTFYPSQTEEHENSIVFDGEKGTMKVGGGPRSAFAQRISSLIQFWVRDKGCIPGFLAALTLEFYEERSAAQES